MRRVVPLVVGLVALSSVAYAQPGATQPTAGPAPAPARPPADHGAPPAPPPVDYEAPSPPSAPPPRYEEKSGSVALGMSVGFTVGGIALMATNNEVMALVGFGAFVAGPSTGHWYAHEAWNTGMGIRLAGVGMMIVGITQVDLDLSWDHNDGEDEEEEDNTLGGVLIVGGLAAYLVGGVYEIFTAPRAAARYNEDQRNLSYGFTLVGRDRTPGLALSGTF